MTLFRLHLLWQEGLLTRQMNPEESLQLIWLKNSLWCQTTMVTLNCKTPNSQLRWQHRWGQVTQSGSIMPSHTWHPTTGDAFTLGWFHIEDLATLSTSNGWHTSWNSLIIKSASSWCCFASTRSRHCAFEWALPNQRSCREWKWWVTTQEAPHHLT